MHIEKRTVDTVCGVDLKNKTILFNQQKLVYWEEQKIAIQDKQDIAKTGGKSSKPRRGTFLYREREGSWEGAL